MHAFATLIICQKRLRKHDFDTLRGWATNEGQGRAPVSRLTWSIEAAAKRMKSATCLSKAIALQRLLARNGHHSELRIGVDKSDGQFAAHAWLIYNGRVLIGGAQMKNYKLLAAMTIQSDGARRRCERTDDK